MRKAARLDPNLEGGSNENRIPDGLHAQSMLSEQELAEAYRLLGHFEANKAAHSEKLFNAASMLDRLSLVEAALRKRVGRVPCGALQSRIETLKNGRICVAVDPDSLWGGDYLLKQMRELFSGTSTFEFRSPD
ncbi:MAG: hypothetical protein IPK75_00185 [Acidobacteria bacterium]|nr:hypothetical protein [Acidobacteriota bacterium]